MSKFGLIGRSLSHSFSPSYFAQKFERENRIDDAYLAYEMDNLENFKQWFLSNELAGVNVTFPYKEEIIKHLDRLDGDAQAIGAVNCIANQGGELVGYNTDAPAFAKSIAPFLENKFERALIMGTGGAAKAVEHALKRWSMPVFYLTRQPREANHLASTDLTGANLPFFKLIINCTPVGTYPNVNEAPELPYESIDASFLLYDLVYNPPMTLFLNRGKARGAQVMNGAKMLELQAEMSWTIWSNK
jgi:shikimate dehydrogenase